MNEKIYAKALRSFDHDKERRSKKGLAFPVEKSLFTQFEASGFVREATEEEIAEAKAAKAALTADSVPSTEENPADETDETDETDDGDDGDEVNSANLPPSMTGEQFVEGNIPDVIARIEGASPELLKAALDAETAKGEKARKGVTEALTAALTPSAV